MIGSGIDHGGVMLGRSLVLFAVVVSLAACETNQRYAPARIQALGVLSDDYRAHTAEMLRRFPPEALGALDERRAAALPLAQAYTDRRLAAGMPVVGAESLEAVTTRLAEAPEQEVQFLRATEARRAAVAQRDAATAELAALDGRAVTPRDIARIVQRRSAEGPSPAPMSRTELEAQVRRDIELRHSARSREAAAARERELVRLAATNLADMPREIADAAEHNLRDARSPFEPRHNARPLPPELRAEEVRLRNAIIARQEAGQREAQQRFQVQALQAQRDAVMASCRTQAALIGASVPSPYMGRGLGGAIASGLAGAVQQAAAENNALQSCLRANGI